MNNNYIEEVKNKWKDTDAYKEYTSKTKNYSKEKWQIANENLNNIMYRFSVCLKSNLKENSIETQTLVNELKEHITSFYYGCTKEILYNIGIMYTEDERFKHNIDQYEKGTAEYIKKAIEFYCKENI